MNPEHAATEASAAEGGFDPALFDALGVDELVPAPLAAWRPLVVEALGFFLDRLPPQRLEAIVADQFALPIEAPDEARLVALLARCPTLHKLGQVLARRPELDPELRRHLQTLESMPSTRPLAPLRARIEASLGAGHGLALADEALAEGSVAVVLPFSWHEGGRRREGVFKVLKPGVEAELADELALLPSVADFLERRAAQLGLPALDYRGTLASVQRLLAREIRLDREQAHMTEAAAFHADDAGLLVPALLPWCSPAMTAMDRVFGPRLTDAALAPGQGQALADTLVRALLARPFWSGEAEAMFHGDLHGGNLLLADDGRLAVLDWSLTARLGKAEREALVAIALGALTLDAARIRAALGALGMLDADDPALAGAVEHALDRLVASGRPIGFDWLVGLLDELALLGASGFGEQLAVFRKSWLSLAGVIRDLGAELAADLPLLSLGLQRFLGEMPARMFAAPDSRAFATHVSNADLIGLGASAWPTSLRYWSRLLAADRAA
ncbi:AarF/UbiB family protein [Thauera phenolivorans]|uniref:AarF/UbiB family protein n=1 Tax=Thauera phenolivorans TaxID=1792543 RepID=UPI000AD25399|nr:AarF/UbiB family protein [Thauera phenolivorans]